MPRILQLPSVGARRQTATWNGCQGIQGRGARAAGRTDVDNTEYAAAYSWKPREACTTIVPHSDMPCHGATTPSSSLSAAPLGGGGLGWPVSWAGIEVRT